MKKIITTMLCLAALGANAQTQVSKYQPGVTVDGITYFLPRTALRVVVTAKKEVFTPGELNKYANRYMHINDAASEGSTKWTLETVSIEPYGVPDTSKVYSIALRSKTVAPFVTLAKDGRILAIRDENADFSLSPMPQEQAAVKPIDPHSFYTQEMTAAASKAKLAELVAQEIFDIRDSYNAITRGEADNTPKDGAQLQLMLASLTKQQEALTTLFTGYTMTSTHVFSFDINPDAAVDRQLVARFSRMLGMVDADDLSGEPIYLSIRALETLPQPVDDADAKKKKAKMTMGVYYNIPVRAEVTLSNAKGTLAKVEMPMAQLGQVDILSNTLFDKNVTTRVIFDPITGGVTKLKEE